MYLHNDTDTFRELIERTSESSGYQPVIIEKDYYVTEFLRNIATLQPNIIFKGGTSLSKCYKLIDRFSEDIDLNIECENRPTESQRKNLKKNIISVINELGLSLTNSDEIKSRRDFNKYIVNYSTLNSAPYLKQNLIIETAVFMRSYPCEKLTASSYICDYLLNNGFEEAVSEYGLQPFTINVQAASRTLIDKLFALADYYLTGKTTGHSRHIYDIYKLLSIVKIDNNLCELMNSVRN